MASFRKLFKEIPKDDHNERQFWRQEKNIYAYLKREKHIEIKQNLKQLKCIAKKYKKEGKYGF